VANICHVSHALLLQGAVSPWVLGWQFAAGERILQDKDVFGDVGGKGVTLVQAQQQGVAVFSEWQLGAPGRPPQPLLCMHRSLFGGPP
jgi:hypothetical protein